MAWRKERAPPKQNPTENSARTCPPSFERRCATAAATSAWSVAGVVWSTCGSYSNLSLRSPVLSVRAKKSMATESTPTSAKRSASSL